MKNLKFLNIQNKQIWMIGYIILFILFLSFVGNISGIQRIISTFILSSVIYFLITFKLKQSIIAGTCFTLLMGLLDNKPFSDYRRKLTYRYESFETKDTTETDNLNIGKSYSFSKTDDIDTTNFKDDDLDKILDEDEKKGNDENEHLKKAGGGLEQLKDLLDMAKKESPNKDMASYTPAEAQRTTYHLIDTVQQLKTTMQEMMPLMKAGNHLLEFNKKIKGQLSQM